MGQKTSSSSLSQWLGRIAQLVSPCRAIHRAACQRRCLECGRSARAVVRFVRRRGRVSAVASAVSWTAQFRRWRRLAGARRVDSSPASSSAASRFRPVAGKSPWRGGGKPSKSSLFLWIPLTIFGPHTKILFMGGSPLLSNGLVQVLQTLTTSAIGDSNLWSMDFSDWSWI